MMHQSPRTNNKVFWLLLAASYGTPMVLFWIAKPNKLSVPICGIAGLLVLGASIYIGLRGKPRSIVGYIGLVLTLLWCGIMASGALVRMIIGYYD
jgi:hypothetical protein